jgi:class 3 adenylate cyclase
MAGETTCVRRTVTVLFVDIVGYTTLVDELDCAVVRELQMDYFDAVAAPVRAYGGVVEKYVGDAVMAVFGADEGDELDTAAAAGVRAGMAVQGALRGRRLAGRFPVRTRVGVATGEVILDRHATRDGGHGMISGSVVGTAARLQAYAPHDTVVVDEPTRRVTDKLIAYQELPPVVVAGKTRPVDLWRALHPQAARMPDLPQTRGYAAPARLPDPVVPAG